jgi:hypothetical protein
VDANSPTRDPDAEEVNVSPGYDYEYDEAHDVAVGSMRETHAPHRVDSPSDVHPGEGGDYGYDEAHDFCAGRSEQR